MLRSLKPHHRATTSPARRVRGQYRAGAVDGRPVPGYLEELGAGEQRHRDLRRAARPRSTTGAGPACRSTCAPASACRRASSEIVVQFRPMPHSIFREAPAPIGPTGWSSACSPTRASSCCLMSKDPGPGGMRLQHVPLDLSFAEAFDVARAGRLRAAAAGRDARQRRPCSCAATRWRPPGAGRPDPRRLGSAKARCRGPTRPAAGARRRDRADRPRRARPGTRISL